MARGRKKALIRYSAAIRKEKEAPSGSHEEHIHSYNGVCSIQTERVQHYQRRVEVQWSGLQAVKNVSTVRR